MKNDNHSKRLRTTLHNYRGPAALALALIFLLAVALASATAGGTGDPRRFGSYEIDLDSGPIGITIRGHASTQIVTISEKDIPAGIKVNYVERGGILHVTTAYKTGEPASDVGTGQLIASMPRYEFVHIKTSSGNVSIDNLSTNHLSIQTKTGSIDVTNTNAALKVQSTTGNQNYKQIYGAIDASSTTGNIVFAHTWGTMKLVSTTGSLSGKQVAIAGNSSFHTSSGSIDMALAYGLGRYTFDIRSTSGRLQLGEIVRTKAINWGNGNILIKSYSESGKQDIQ